MGASGVARRGARREARETRCRAVGGESTVENGVAREAARKSIESSSGAAGRGTGARGRGGATVPVAIEAPLNRRQKGRSLGNLQS